MLIIQLISVAEQTDLRLIFVGNPADRFSCDVALMEESNARNTVCIKMIGKKLHLLSKPLPKYSQFIKLKSEKKSKDLTKTAGTSIDYG